jgi:hypothetical protein
MSVCWEFGVPVTPILTHARVPLLGTDIEGRSRNMKKSKKMGNVGSPLLTKSRKEPAAIRLQDFRPQLQAR